MRVRKYNGQIYGADLTASERKAMDIEIKKQVLILHEQYKNNVDAMILYVLASRYGWKAKRLRQFWDSFTEEHRALREYYEMEEDGDNEWLAMQKLKEIGVDVVKWNEEETQ